jgi:hypothetical protein
MLKIGDRVKILECYNMKLIGKTGKVALVTTGIRPGSPPAGETRQHHPGLQDEPRYSVELDEGDKIHNLRENQLYILHANQ